MTTRETLRRSAERAGWEINADMGLHSFEDEWTRKPVLDPSTRLGRMLAAAPFQARERIYVGYTTAGGVSCAYLYGPGQQSINTGQFVGPASRCATGKGKRETVMRWMQERITHG